MIKENDNCGGSMTFQGASTSEGVLHPIILQNCYQKLHKNEIIWTERGTRASLARPWINHWPVTKVTSHNRRGGYQNCELSLSHRPKSYKF